MVIRLSENRGQSSLLLSWCPPDVLGLHVPELPTPGFSGWEFWDLQSQSGPFLTLRKPEKECPSCLPHLLVLFALCPILFLCCLYCFHKFYRMYIHFQKLQFMQDVCLVANQDHRMSLIFLLNLKRSVGVRAVRGLTEGQAVLLWTILTKQQERPVWRFVPIPPLEAPLLGMMGRGPSSLGSRVDISCYLALWVFTKWDTLFPRLLSINVLACNSLHWVKCLFEQKGRE